MVKKALLIGINYFGTSAQLGGCINDVKNVQTLLKEQWKFTDSECRVLTDDVQDPTKRPTHQNIIDGMKWLCANAKQGDRLFMSYSGHGSWVYDKNGDEDDGKDEVLCPVDYVTAGFITDDLIRETLVTKIPADCWLTGLIDACHSGSSYDLRYNFAQTGSNEIKINKFGNYSATNGRVVMFSGCMDSQTSSDATEVEYNSNKNQRQGAMTYAFIKILKDNNCNLKFRELIRRIRGHLKRKGYSQIPQLSSGKWLDINKKFSVV
jgi:hypothetical protein